MKVVDREELRKDERGWREFDVGSERSDLTGEDLSLTLGEERKIESLRVIIRISWLEPQGSRELMRGLTYKLSVFLSPLFFSSESFRRKVSRQDLKFST